MMYSLDSSGLAHMSAPCQIEPSSIHDMLSGAGWPNDSPRYPYSSPAKCFTKPSRFVPVGVIGRRRSYSLRLSTLDNSTARLAWSLRCNSSLRSDTALTSPLTENPHQGTANHPPPTNQSGEQVRVRFRASSVSSHARRHGGAQHSPFPDGVGAVDELVDSTARMRSSLICSRSARTNVPASTTRYGRS